MFRITLSIFLLLSVPAFSQNRIRLTLPLVSQLGTRPPFTNEVVEVLGYSAQGDWGSPKLFRWDPTNTLATNALRLKASSTVGRYIHEWDGDVLAFGADRNGLLDSTAAFQSAIDSASSARSNGTFTLRIPGGVYRVSNTLTVASQRIAIIGETANASAFNNSKILFTGTNMPILSLSGTKLEVRNLALEYEVMQGPLATSSVGLQINAVVASIFENLSIRKAAYCIKDTTTDFQFQNSWRDIYCYSFSRAGIRFDRQNTVSSFDNIYVQNALDGLETSLVNIASTTNNTNNVSFTLSALPTRINTNMMVRISGLSPSSLNGLIFITNITGLVVSGRDETDPGTITDGVGTLEVTARYCAESPVDLGYGWVTIKGLDIEHCIVDDDCALALRCELNELSDVHFEQVYGIQNPFSFISGNSGSGVNIGSISMANLGFNPGSTNYLIWAGFQSARGDKGTPFSLGYLRARDIAKSGATWYPARKSASQYPDLLLLGGYDLEGEVRAYGDARFTDENQNMSRPVRFKGGSFTGGQPYDSTNVALPDTMLVLRPVIAQHPTNAASWTGIHISPTNSDLSFGANGGYPFRYSSTGLDRFLVHEDGRMTITAGNSNSSGRTTIFRGHDQVYPSGRVNLIYGQTNATSRNNIGPNYLYVTDNAGANAPLFLQLLGSYIIVGNGTSGSGLRIGSAGNALIQNIQSTTFAWNPGSLANGVSEQVLSTGLAAVSSNDQILASLSSIGTNQFVISAVATGNANEVAVTLLNASGATVDLPSGTLRITVIDF